MDWIEGHNARLVGHGNEQAVAFAAEHAKPVVAVSDAHSLIEIGVAYSALDGDPSTPEALLAALASGELVPGRATYFARLLTPVSKVVQRARGQRSRPARAACRPGRRSRARERPDGRTGPSSDGGRRDRAR